MSSNTTKLFLPTNFHHLLYRITPSILANFTRPSRLLHWARESARISPNPLLIQRYNLQKARYHQNTLELFFSPIVLPRKIRFFSALASASPPSRVFGITVVGIPANNTITRRLDSSMIALVTPMRRHLFSGHLSESSNHNPR